jgi:hypothetical protein
MDMRLNTIKNVGQFTTKDNLTITISSFGTWRITHPEMFQFKVDDIQALMRNMITGVFCTMASSNTLDELMLKREELEDMSIEIMNNRSINFGFEFKNIEFNEITLPNDILNAVSASALARRNAEAKLIEAKAEIESALMYKEAADQVSQNPISLQLQWLETMKDIAKSTVSTLVLPDTCIGSWKKIIASGDGSYPTRRSRNSDKNSDTWEVNNKRVKPAKRNENTEDSAWELPNKKEKKSRKKRSKRKKKSKRSRRNDSDSENESLG